MPDSSFQRNRRSSSNLFGSFSAGGSLGRGFDAVFGSGDDDESLHGEDLGRLRRWWRWQRELWLEPKGRAVAKAVEKWWGRWWVLVGLPAALVSWDVIVRRRVVVDTLDTGCHMVCNTISTVRLDGR